MGRLIGYSVSEDVVLGIIHQTRRRTCLARPINSPRGANSGTRHTRGIPPVESTGAERWVVSVPATGSGWRSCSKVP